VNWEIVDKTERFSKIFDLKTSNTKIKCDYYIGNEEIGIEQVLFHLEITLNSMIHLRETKDEDRVRISLRNHLLDFDVFVPFRFTVPP
jgi:hypothetical protein